MMEVACWGGPKEVPVTIQLMHGGKAIEVAAPSFELAAGAVMAELQASLGELLRSLPGQVRRAVDVERSLHLDKKLAWQVFRLATTQGLTEATNVPALPSVRRLLEAARRRKLTREVIDRVAQAFDRFEELVVHFAGDREGLNALLSGTSSGKNDQYELKIRKALFRSNAHVWGTQVQTQVRTVIWYPRPGENHEDVALIMGDIGMQRLRENEPLSLVRWIRTHDSPHNEVVGGGELEPRVQTGPSGDKGVRLLHEFCSDPLPQMVPRQSVLGGVETELVIPAGRAGAVTIYSRQVMENGEPTPHTLYDGRMFVTMPVETVVWELLVPAGLTDPASARVAVYGRRPHPEQVYDERPRDLLPQQESVRYMGQLEHVPPLEESPRHPEAIRAVLTEFGWTGARFDVYRSRIMYPVLHTLLCVRTDAVRR
jgi:hypothetical protein